MRLMPRAPKFVVDEIAYCDSIGSACLVISNSPCTSTPCVDCSGYRVFVISLNDNSRRGHLCETALGKYNIRRLFYNED